MRYTEERDALSHDWTRWLDELGLRVMLIPNVGSDPSWIIKELPVSCLILSGGNDLAGKADGSDHSGVRDQTEMALLEGAIRRGLPVLGVCRGLHVINLYCGGGLQSDIVASGFESHRAVQHDVEVQPPFSSFVPKGRTVLETNSYHNQGLARDDVAPELRIFATALKDGLVEGIYHPEQPLVAVQWHPERGSVSQAFDAALLMRLIDEGAFWA